MAIDRRDIKRLTVINPDKRTYADERPDCSPAADDAAMARQGFHTLDRAPPLPWNLNRLGLAPPVREEANVDRGESIPNVVIY